METSKAVNLKPEITFGLVMEDHKVPDRKSWWNKSKAKLNPETARELDQFYKYDREEIVENCPAVGFATVKIIYKLKEILQ